MLIHKTSWSTISKKMTGRTENSIKNYFYSTIRRIQASPVNDFFQKKASGEEPKVTERSEFIDNYSVNKLNILGNKICLFLWDHRETDKKMRTYLMDKISKDKKKDKGAKGKKSETGSISSRGGKRQKGNQGLFPLNGINPLLPLLLNTGLPIQQDTGLGMGAQNMAPIEAQKQALETVKAIAQLIGMSNSHNANRYNPN